MFKKIDIFWSVYLAHRCFKFDVSIDDIIDVSKILRIPIVVGRQIDRKICSWMGFSIPKVGQLSTKTLVCSVWRS
jgi:hypothetical protein